MYLKKLLKIFVFVAFFCVTALADDALLANANFKITVFYPDVRKPYSDFFKTIISGIKEQSNQSIHLQIIDKSTNESDIFESLQQNKPDVVILLGGNFKPLQDKIAASYNTIHGATFFNNKDALNGRVGISMDPEPAQLFTELIKIHPAIKKIHVVFEANSNGWLIQRAAQAAKNKGLILVSHEASSTQQAALIYRELARNNNHSENALWLLHHDPTLDTKSLLPRILADAWKYKQVVISSNPSHVRRGALLSLLPDNQKIGQDLALVANNMLNGQKINIEPMRTSLVVANIRTAKHLSGTIRLQQKNNFALTYPRKNN
ncbi:MAG: hypothetical protein COB22_04810 [Cycloclasticus sp.]|nr:MAG: hypothetical protein COB22_04810 [Cycloclasticus sp.]